MNLSDHFTLEEAVLSQTAQRQNIDNTPSMITILVMQNTAKMMERVRALLGVPVIVSSWYRSKAVNAAVGGVANSQHISGEAVDFICPAYGTPADICRQIIKFPELVSFDQLILEHTWVHISTVALTNPPGKNRNQVLSLLSSGFYADGLTDKSGAPL